VFARLLGPLEIELEGRPVPLGGRAPRALLARLLLDANRAVAVDRLVEDLWGEEAPASAVKMIQIHVSALRKVLPEGMLVTRSRGYALEIDPDAVDLVRFEALRREGQEALATGSHELAAERLREAAGLWRGPALGEFDEPFAAIESARLEELRVASIEDRIEAELALGRHAGLVGELDALVARHPLRERLRGQLMLALYRSGRQAEALDGYRRLRAMLTDELGIEPSPPLRELERRMLQQDPRLELAPARPPAAPILRPSTPIGRSAAGSLRLCRTRAWSPLRRGCPVGLRAR
jgi:DNA-binding SARP family transcriptional activator